MADGGSSSKQEETKWILLSGIKSTADVLLASRNANIWSTYGGINRIVEDLERIFRHGLKSHKVSVQLWLKATIVEVTLIKQIHNVNVILNYLYEFYKLYNR